MSNSPPESGQSHPLDKGEGIFARKRFWSSTAVPLITSQFAQGQVQEKEFEEFPKVFVVSKICGLPRKECALGANQGRTLVLIAFDWSLTANNHKQSENADINVFHKNTFFNKKRKIVHTLTTPYRTYINHIQKLFS